MKNVLISFSGSAYDPQTKLTLDRAPGMGADETWIYDDRWLLSTEFGQSPEFQWLLHQRGVGNPHGGRGLGWFSWKPYIIEHALDRLDDGDCVLYLDADTYPIHDFSMLFDICRRDKGHMVFMATAKTEPLCNRQWCKRDCFIRMDMDYPAFWHAGHAVARFICFEKGALGLDHFLNKWQKFCLDPLATTFEPSVLGPELDGLPHTDGPQGNFREHRTEQAIFTNLVTERGWKLYREACGFGKDCPQDWDLYPQLFEQRDLGRPKTLAGSAYRNVA